VTTSSLAEEIAALPAPLRARLDARGFEPTQLVAWAARVGLDKDGRNRLSGAVLPPQPGDLVDAPVPGSAEHARALGARPRGHSPRRARALRARRRHGHAHGRGRQGPGRGLPGRTVPRPAPRGKRSLERHFRAILAAVAHDERGRPTGRCAERPRRASRLDPDFCHLRAVRLAAPHPRGASSSRATSRRAQRVRHGPRRSARRAAQERACSLRSARTAGKVVCIANIDNLGATIDPGPRRRAPRSHSAGQRSSWSTRSAAIAAAARCAGTGADHHSKSSACPWASIRKRARVQHQHVPGQRGGAARAPPGVDLRRGREEGVRTVTRRAVRAAASARSPRPSPPSSSACPAKAPISRFLPVKDCPSSRSVVRNRGDRPRSWHPCAERSTLERPTRSPTPARKGLRAFRVCPRARRSPRRRRAGRALPRDGADAGQGARAGHRVGGDRPARGRGGELRERAALPGERSRSRSSKAATIAP
jgi:hypothetical protein